MLTNATEDSVPHFGNEVEGTSFKPMRRSMKLFTGAYQRSRESSFLVLQVIKTETLVERNLFFPFLDLFLFLFFLNFCFALFVYVSFSKCF